MAVKSLPKASQMEVLKYNLDNLLGDKTPDKVKEIVNIAQELDSRVSLSYDTLTLLRNKDPAEFETWLKNNSKQLGSVALLSHVNTLVKENSDLALKWAKRINDSYYRKKAMKAIEDNTEH